MSGATESLGFRLRIGKGTYSSATVLRRHSRGASLEFVDSYCERRAKHGGIVGGLRFQRQLLATGHRQWSTQHSTGVFKHEIHLLRSDFLRSHDYITLILAVLVIDHYHHFALAEIVDGTFYRIEFHCYR